MKKFLPIFAILVALLFAPVEAALTGVQQVDANYIPVATGGTGTSFRTATESTVTVTNIALTTNVLTVTGTHHLAVGEIVTLALLTGPTLFADCNGTYVVASVSTTVSFTVALTHADIASGAATGTATAFYESPVAAGTTLIRLTWPTNAVSLQLYTTAVMSIQPTATTIAAGTGGSWTTIANTIYTIKGKPSDVTYIIRTNSGLVHFKFDTVN